MLFGIICVVILAIVLYSLLRGAPYVPVRSQDLSRIFLLLNVSPGGLVVDLGSGDGVILKAASERGFRAVGVEINPFFVLLSRLRLRAHKTSKVIWKDMFSWSLPEDTEAVFVFAGGPFVDKIEAWLQRQADEQRRTLKVVSYGFAFNKHSVITKDGAALLHIFEPNRA